MKAIRPLSIMARIVVSDSFIRRVNTPFAARTLSAYGRTLASLSLSRGSVSVGGGVTSALGGICGEGVWSVALIADLVRERSFVVFVSETVTVAILNRLFF